MFINGIFLNQYFLNTGSFLKSSKKKKIKLPND